jgi:hypothetical protein
MELVRKNKKYIIMGIAIIVIILIIYFVLTLDYGHKVLFDGYDYFYNDRVEYIGPENMKDSEDGIKYTYSMWIRVDNMSANAHWQTNDDTPKTILYNYGSPNILFMRKENTVRIQVMYLNKNGYTDYYNFDLENFENQLWSHIVITVDSRNVNIYKNGSHYLSKILPHVNIKTYKLLQIGDKHNNFNGYVGYLEYFNYVLSPSTVDGLYKSRIKKLPYKLKSYEDYEYLRKEEEEKNKEVSVRFKKFLI